MPSGERQGTESDGRPQKWSGLQAVVRGREKRESLTADHDQDGVRRANDGGQLNVPGEPSLVGALQVLRYVDAHTKKTA